MICLLPLEKGSSFQPRLSLPHELRLASRFLRPIKELRVPRIQQDRFDWTFDGGRRNESCWCTTPGSYGYVSNQQYTVSGVC